MIKQKDKVSAFMVFFLIASVQIGVGVLGFQSVIIKYAGHDAWISVLLAGGIVSIVIWFLYQMLNRDEGSDIIGIHQFTFGKWLGNLLSLIISVYFFLGTVVVMRTYLEVIQVWMFPQVKIWALLLVVLPLLYYVVANEFRIVVGVCFFGVVYPAFLIFTLFFPLQYADYVNILPVMDHSLMEIVKSASSAILSFLGFSTLLVFYPFISDAKKSQKFAHMANLATTVIYTFLCIVTYLYYNQDELDSIIWPTLGLWNKIEMPFLARFEYFGIATLFFSVLPNMVLTIWVSSRIVHRVTRLAVNRTVLVWLVLLFGASVLIDSREDVNWINDAIGKIGPWFVLGYIPILYLLNIIRRKVKDHAA